MAQVSLQEVSKVYQPGDIKAVDRISLDVESREFVVLVGPSGCGKSTTLRMVAGLEEVTSGKITIGDRLVNDVPPKDRDIAMVFQTYALYPHMTVFENMAFGLSLRGYPKLEVANRVKEAAEILGISRLLNRKPRELSGGERQRVALGRAIVRKPVVFLFDEPLSNLDAKLRGQMRTELNKLHLRLQSTMIYVTHDQMEAMTLGNRIAVMHQGVIQQVADPANLYEHPVNRFVASFIGSPPMNFILGKIIRKNGRFYFDQGPCRVKVADEMNPRVASFEGNPILFGIRPEDIYDKLFVQYAPPENTVTARVEVVEPMGAEVYLHLLLGAQSVTARVGGHERPKVNQDIDLVFDMSKVHFFDPNTEVAIV
ncbi:MAG: sn-glycerol-3-phosphate ABC transporter ATP-binding protein UgpC [Candidatus Omnitrophica bacterium]|nr:sn-glycerol-3-phosphate ABC transporter ATP-binding protein UgpC [Candidatus Omnitrophota bacterium]